MAKPGNIHFFPEGVKYDLKEKRKIRNWIKQAIENENHRLVSLNYIFTTDEVLFELNQHYLGHSTLTDILTFNMSDNEQKIEGDVYISIERAKENAKVFDEPFNREVHRLLIHGVLHLTGYRDKTAAEKAEMKAKEEYYLSLLA